MTVGTLVLKTFCDRRIFTLHLFDNCIEIDENKHYALLKCLSTVELALTSVLIATLFLRKEEKIGKQQTICYFNFSDI